VELTRYALKRNQLLASEIADYLALEYTGEDIVVYYPSSFISPENNTITYLEENVALPELSAGLKLIVIARKGLVPEGKGITVIVSDNPRKDFYLVVNEFFTKREAHDIHPTAAIRDGAEIGINVNIGRNTFVDDGVKIGNNTYIGSNVVLSGKILLGNDCVVKDGAIIGADGYAFLREDDSRFIYMPQFGLIDISEEVWIGANATIERPFFGATKIGRNVKVDDLVHLGQSVKIGQGSRITAGAVLADNVSVGRDCFLGINCSVREGIIIGDGTVVGMGGVVTSDLAAGCTYAGVPARPLNDRHGFRK
jgi:UDP-3-O-[3-hydroxymyristoyl] glucosamine N-acyltransferase